MVVVNLKDLNIDDTKVKVICLLFILGQLEIVDVEIRCKSILGCLSRFKE